MNLRHTAECAVLRGVVAMLGLVAVLAPSTARAAVLTWGAAGGGGTGNWDTTTATWYDGVGAVTWSNAAPDSAVFAGTAGTVTLTEGITANALTFTTTGYTVTGNTLTLAGGTAANVTLGSGISATIASTVSGTAALVKLGAGTLTLSSANN